MKHLSLCALSLALALVSGCQSTGSTSADESVSDNQKSTYFSEPKRLLDKLEVDINQGSEDQLSYFAPLSYQVALEEFNDASEEYTDITENGASSFNVFKTEAEQYAQAKKEILDAINLANSKLTMAYQNKTITQEVLADILLQNTMLTSIGTADVYAKDYRKTQGRIDDLIEYIDQGKVEKAQSKQASLLADMQTLEVRTVRKNFLGQLDADIAHIKDKELAVDVPISFKQLTDARNHTDTIITATPRATEEIKAAVELANFELAHLYHIAKEVSELKSIEPEQHEQYLLSKENLLHTISVSLGSKDVRDLAVEEQVESIARQASTMHDKLETANTAIAALQNDSSASSEATQLLREEFKTQIVNLNAKYDALVIENSELNKKIQTKDLEVSRLTAYKNNAIQLDKKRAAEQKAVAEQEKAKKALEEKALAEQEAAKKIAEQNALAKEEEAKALAEAQAVISNEVVAGDAEVNDVAEQSQETVTELNVETNTVESDVNELVETITEPAENSDQ